MSCSHTILTNDRNDFGIPYFCQAENHMKINNFLLFLMLLYNLRVVNTCIFSKLEILIFLSHQLTNSGTYWCATFRTKRDDPLGTSSRTPLLRNLPFVGKVIWGFSVVAHIWAEITVKVELRKEFASHKMDGLKIGQLLWLCFICVLKKEKVWDILCVFSDKCPGLS